MRPLGERLNSGVLAAIAPKFFRLHALHLLLPRFLHIKYLDIKNNRCNLEVEYLNFKINGVAK